MAIQVTFATAAAARCGFAVAPARGSRSAVSEALFFLFLSGAGVFPDGLGRVGEAADEETSNGGAPRRSRLVGRLRRSSKMTRRLARAHYLLFFLTLSASLLLFFRYLGCADDYGRPVLRYESNEAR